MSRLQDVILRGTRASQPVATAVAPGTLYFVTDEGVTEQSDGTIWNSYSGVSAARYPLYGMQDIIEEPPIFPLFAPGEPRLGNPTVDDYVLSS